MWGKKGYNKLSIHFKKWEDNNRVNLKVVEESNKARVEIN